MKWDEPDRIFIVDDDDDVREVLIQCVDSIYHIRGFPSAVEAVQAIVDGDVPSVIVTDYKMPGLDGIGFVHELIELGFGGIPVVMITGFADRAAILESLNSGVFALIEKPFQFRTIINTINRAVAYGNTNRMSQMLASSYRQFVRQVKSRHDARASVWKQLHEDLPLLIGDEGASVVVEKLKDLDEAEFGAIVNESVKELQLIDEQSQRIAKLFAATARKKAS